MSIAFPEACHEFLPCLVLAPGLKPLVTRILIPANLNASMMCCIFPTSILDLAYITFPNLFGSARPRFIRSCKSNLDAALVGPTPLSIKASQSTVIGF